MNDAADWFNVIGYIYANIAGDSRYTTKVEVTANDDWSVVIVRRLENSPIGGMDGPGGSHSFDEMKKIELSSPSDREILDAIYKCFNETIKRYGKPTKEFLWCDTREKGLSVAKCARARERNRLCSEE